MTTTHLETTVDVIDRRLAAMLKMIPACKRAAREQDARLKRLLQIQRARGATKKRSIDQRGISKELKKAMNELAKSQKAYFDSLRKGRNGHK